MGESDIDTIILECFPCPGCQKVGLLEVHALEYERYRAGVNIRDAFPDMSVDDRELLITGYCAPCWDRLFPEDEDDE